jgi:hypothetical protein
MKDIFTSYTPPQGKENIKRFSNMKHHNLAIRAKKPMCIKYQCKGKCRTRCVQAHVRPLEITPKTMGKIKEAFQKAYIV